MWRRDILKQGNTSALDYYKYSDIEMIKLLKCAITCEIWRKNWGWTVFFEFSYNILITFRLLSQNITTSFMCHFHPPLKYINFILITFCLFSLEMLRLYSGNISNFSQNITTNFSIFFSQNMTTLFLKSLFFINLLKQWPYTHKRLFWVKLCVYLLIEYLFSSFRSWLYLEKHHIFM